MYSSKRSRVVLGEDHAQHEDREDQPVVKKAKTEQESQEKQQPQAQRSAARDRAPLSGTEEGSAQPTAAVRKAAKQRPLPPTELEKARRKSQEEYFLRLRWMTKAGNLEWDMKHAQEGFEEQELTIRELGEEAEVLEKKLEDEYKAAKLGWKLLWGQRAHIEELEKREAAFALLDLRYAGSKTTTELNRPSNTLASQAQEQARLLQIEVDTLQKDNVELKEILADFEEKTKLWRSKNTKVWMDKEEAVEKAKKAEEDSAVLRVLNDQAAMLAVKDRKRIEELESKQK